MDDDMSLVPTGRIANFASVPIALENRFPQAADVLLVLWPEGVSGCAADIGFCVAAFASDIDEARMERALEDD